MSEITVTCYVHPEPQGSAKAFVIAGKARVTSDNRKLKPYRQEVTRTAMAELERQNIARPAAAKHTPVWLKVNFFLAKPASIPKRRQYPVVKPDIDKLLRATLDSLTGVLFEDDAQVIACLVGKQYDALERVEITMRHEPDGTDKRS